VITDINSEDRLVQKTFADHLHDALGWECVYAYKIESFGPSGTLGRTSEREVVLVRDLRAALARLNSGLPESAREQAIEKLTRVDFARSLLVMCGAFRVKNLDDFPNLNVKKIPKAVLNRCEWGHDDYSLEIKNLPMKATEENRQDAQDVKIGPRTKTERRAAVQQQSLFASPVEKGDDK
jgi:hypothetical protein